MSFETSRPAIYRQNLATGQREQLTNFKGLNGAPAWSPDGNTVAYWSDEGGEYNLWLAGSGSDAARATGRKSEYLSAHVAGGYISV